MYKVLLVDDERLTREAISQNVPWNNIGFALIGTAENGKEAVALVEKEQPDLVLTDICMPVMDGIALSGYLYEHYPETKVIIISGYDDFEYAKQAIKYGVSNYILKPITSSELVEELEKTRLKIEQSQKKKSEFEAIRHRFAKSVPTLRSHFLTRLIEGNYLKNDIDAQMNQLEISLRGRYQAVVMLEVEDSTAFFVLYPTAADELIKFAVANIAEEIAAEIHDIVFFENELNGSHFIAAADSREALSGLIESICRKMITAIWDYVQTKVCALIGEVVQGPENWKQSYRSALDAREYKFLFKGHDLIFGVNVIKPKGNETPELTHKTEKLVLMIKLNQIEEIKIETAAIFLRLRESGREKKELLVIIQNLIMEILIGLEDHLPETVKGDGKTAFIMQVMESRHLSDIEAQFLEYCIGLSEEIAGKREDPSEKQAIRAMDYIEKNYMNEDMSLNMVCEYLCVSTSYFSAIFKNYTGETFIEALTRVRIDKAKDLLESSDMKNYEVAMAVGYRDPHYFSSIFKKRVKMTPTEYARRLKRGP